MRSIEQIPQLPVRKERHLEQYLVDSVIAVGGALVMTGLIYAFHLYPTIPNISIVYLLLILALASTRGRYAALLTAAVAFLSFDFFLVPPFYSFTIDRWEEWLALGVFLATALITSQLAAVMRRSLEQARIREREGWILYESGRVINSTNNLDEQLDSIALSLVRVFSPLGVRECALLLPDKHGVLTIHADAPIRIERFALSPEEMAAARDVMMRGKIGEVGPSDPGASEKHMILRLIPLTSGKQILGVLCMRIEEGISWFASKQPDQGEQEELSDRATFFWTFLDQTTLILERASLRAQVASDD